MNKIEKVMRDVRRSTPNLGQGKAYPLSKKHSQARHPGMPDTDEVVPLSEQLADTEAALSLDYARLRRAGIVAPNGMTARVADEYRRIKRPLLANAAGRTAAAAENTNLIMVSSSVPGEGKTHTSINLALNIARDRDLTVLLVDADVIKRDISGLLGLDTQPGLVDVLSSDYLDVGDTLLRTDAPHLVVLPAGQRNAEAAELLSSQRMERLVGELSQRYPDRIIIFDSPPLLATAEAQLLAGLMGQVVIVVEAGGTRQHMVEEAIATLDNSKPIGLVLNKSQSSFGQDYYGGYYGYGTSS